MLTSLGYKTAVKILLVVIGLLLLGSGGLLWAYRHEKGQKLVAAFRADSIAAINSKTEELTDKKVQEAIDATEIAVQRRVVQTQVARFNELAKVLEDTKGQVAVLQNRVRATIAGLRDTASGTVISSAGDSVRVDSFHIRKVPYTANAIVRIPPNERSRLTLDVSLDTAVITTIVTCGPAEQGVRRADVTLTRPAWLNTEVVEAQQDKEVCNNAALPKESWFKPQVSLFVGPVYNPLSRQGEVGVGIGLTWRIYGKR